MTTHHTVCNRDCPDACGLVATVEDGRLVRLGGDPDHPVTKGFICYRTSHFPETQNSPDRLTHPLLRKDGALVPATWDEALGFVADRLLAIRAESGPAAILHYRSGGSLGMLKMLVDRFFEVFGPVSVKRGDICSGAGDTAQETDFGDEDSHDVFDVLKSRSILLWGKNPYVSNVHLVPLLMEAKKKGARVVLIDPVRHKTANLADATILVAPGGDFDLAMGAAALLFARGEIDPQAASFCDDFDAFRALALSRTPAEWAARAGITLEDASLVADMLAARPCSIQIGWGMGRRSNGSAIVRALDALCAVSGNLGIPGGGASFYFKRRGAFDTGFLEKKPPRTLCEPLLGQEILDAKDPAVRAVWITAGNPVAMLPDSAAVARALETRELVVVVDSFLTDTARRATVVLPTTTLVEDDDLLGAYGHHWLGASTPALAPPAGVLSDLEIVQRLALIVDSKTRANGAGIAKHIAGSSKDWKRRMLAKVEPMGVTVEKLEAGVVKNPLTSDVLFAEKKFATSTGRMKLVHEAPASPP
jgi:anaerobic selenocysteine-containing dehydrogenase